MFCLIPIKKRFLLSMALVLCLAGSILFVPPAVKAASSEVKPGVKVPILMYHSVLRDPKLAGKYVISPETVEEDIKYLKSNGYTTIFVSELSDAVRNGAPLPEKPVILTLDDGYLNNLTYVLPLLEKYDCKAVISVVGSFADRFSEEKDHSPTYSHLTWDDIQTLMDSGRVEIGNHTFDMHSTDHGRRGCAKKKGESDEAYQKAFSKDIGKLQKEMLEHCGAAPVTFAYPYGFIAEGSVPVLKEMGFTAALTCYERLNYITGDPEELMSLGRFNRPSGISTEKFMKKVGV